MSRLYYNDDFNSSVNRYRREVEESYKRREKEQAKRDRQNNSLKRKVSKATQPVQSLARDAMMHVKLNDPTTNEIRNVKRTAGMVTGFVSGAALAIASAAVSGLKAAEIDDKARRLANDTASLQYNDYNQLEKSLNSSDEERRTMTLRTYNEDVASRTDYYRASYYDELERREETKREIAAASEENKKVYNSNKNALELERSQAEKKYQEDSKKFEEQRETIKNTYDQGIASAKESHKQKIESIDKEYNNKKSDIEKSFSGEEKSEERKARINDLNKERADAKEKADRDYKEKESKLQSNKKNAEDAQGVAEAKRKQDYDKQIKDINVSIEGLKSTYELQNRDLQKKAQDSIKDVNRAKNEYLHRTEAREMPRDNSSIQELKPRGTQLETKLGPVHVQGVPVGFVTSRSVENIRNTMGQLNIDLAKRSIMELGSKEDRDLLNKYEKDEANRKRAKAAGMPFESQLSEVERKRVQDSIAAFGGTGFDSESNLKMTLKNSQNAAAAIQSKLDENKKLFSTNHASYESAVKELKGMRSQVTDSINAKKALANGKNLSDAEKAQLKSKILSKEAENNLRGKITKGEEKLKSKRAELNNLQNKMKRQEIAIAGINKQNQFLKRNGKALVSGSIYEDTKKSLKYKAKATKKEKKAQALKLKRGRAIQKNKIKKADKLKLKIARNQRAAARAKENRIAAMKRRSKSDRGKKMARKAARKWRNSVRALQKRLESKTLNGNILHSELKRIKRTTKNAAQYYTMGVNGALTITKVAAKMIFAPLTITNFVGKRLNAKQAKILGRQKNGVGLTRGQAIWARRMQNSRFLQRSMRFNNKINKLTHSKAFGRVTKVGKGLIMAPAAVLTLPNKLMNLPQTMMMGAAKGTAKVAGKAIGATSRTLGKGVRVGGRALGRGAKFIHRKTAGKAINKLRNSKFGKFAKASKNRFNRIKSRITRPFKKAAQKARKLLFDNRFTKLLKKLLGAIVAFVQTVVSYVLMAILYAVLFAFFGIIIIVIILLVVVLLASILGMIFEFLYSLTARYDAELRNNPGFIAHMAANYRSEELRIYNFFVTNTARKADDGQKRLEVSTNPLFFEVYDPDFVIKGLVGDSAEINSSNIRAQNILTRLKNIHNSKGENNDKLTVEKPTTEKTLWSWFTDFFNLNEHKKMNDNDCVVKSDIAKYDEVSVTYLLAQNNLYKQNGEPNNTEIKKYVRGEKKDDKINPGYEISNAKDALAIGDAVFQIKDDAQTYEILAYLGVGATQSDDGRETLFWKSHDIVYLSGTKPSDVYYHYTKKANGDNADYSKIDMAKIDHYTTKKYYNADEEEEYPGIEYNYTVNPSKFNSTPSIENPNTTKCDNQVTKVISFIRKIKTTVYRPRHTHNNNSLWTTQAKNATQASGLNPGSKPSDYNEWYKDLGDLSFEYSQSGSFKPSYTEAGNLREFIYDVSNRKVWINNCPSNMVKLEDYSDKVFIKDCNFEKLYVVKSSKNEYLIAAIINNKLYQVLNKEDAKNVLTPSITDGKLATGSGLATKDDVPNLLVLHRAEDEDESYGNCYVPWMYYKSGSNTTTANEKISNSINSYSVSWGNFRSKSSNMKDLCKAKNNGHLINGHYKITDEFIDRQCFENVSYCQGHIKLDTAIIVTTVDSQYSILDKASELAPQEEEYKFAFYTNDEAAGVSGWGGMNVHAFDPGEDFAPGGSVRSLAEGKANEKGAEYDWDESFNDKVGNYYLIGIKQETGNKVRSIKESEDHKLTWVLYNFQNETYYTKRLISGPQKDIPVYDTDWDKIKLSMKIVNGKATFEKN